MDEKSNICYFFLIVQGWSKTKDLKNRKDLYATGTLKSVSVKYATAWLIIMHDYYAWLCISEFRYIGIKFSWTKAPGSIKKFIPFYLPCYKGLYTIS